MPDINRTIDFLHALWNQYGDKFVTIDGDEEEIADICFAAVYLIEKKFGYKETHPMGEICNERKYYKGVK